MALRKKADRADGLVNAISGVGTRSRDKAVGNQIQFVNPLTAPDCEQIYRANGTGRRIVDLPIQEMTREWFEVDGDSDGLVLAYLETLHAKQAIQHGLRWASLYGGSLVCMGLDDGQADISQPLNESKLRGISFFHIYDRWQVTWTTSDLYSDPNEPKFNTPERYRVAPYSVTAAGGPTFIVHETRVLKFMGAPIPPRAEREQHGWGDSVLQAPYEDLLRFEAAHAHAGSLLEEWAIGVVTVKNLVSLLASKDGEAKVRKRLEVMDLGKSVLRSLLLAEGETFERKTQSIAGLPETMDRFAQKLSSSTGIPVTLLLGEPPSGLRATGQSNRENWFDDVRGQQESRLQPQLERLVHLVFISKDGPTSGKEPDNWKINFQPLIQSSPKDEAELRKAVADTDVAYINAGVLEPAEVAVSRFGGDHWSSETVIDPALHKVEPPAAEPPLPAPTVTGSNGPAQSEPPPPHVQ